MNRRSLLQASLALAGAALVSGHSTSRPWSALQVKHWLIVAARDDAEASRLAGAAATLLAARLPESQALAVQAENDREVVQLLRAHQLSLAVLSIEAANDALQGGASPVHDSSVPLRTVAPFGAHLLVALEDYSTDKAAHIAAALAGFRWRDGSAPTRRSGPQSKVPLHAGATRFKQALESKMGQ